MALGRTYTAISNLVTYTGTSATPVFYGAGTSTSTADFEELFIGSYAGSSASYPANGTLLVQVARVTGTVGGGTTVTGNPKNSSDIAANTTFKDASGAAITGLTIGAILGQKVIPFTAGAGWGEWVTPGAEWRLPASGLFAVYLTASQAGTATQFGVELTFVE